MKLSHLYFILAAIYAAPYASKSVALVVACFFMAIAMALLFIERE